MECWRSVGRCVLISALLGLSTAVRADNGMLSVLNPSSSGGPLQARLEVDLRCLYFNSGAEVSAVTLSGQHVAIASDPLLSSCGTPEFPVGPQHFDLRTDLMSLPDGSYQLDWTIRHPTGRNEVYQTSFLVHGGRIHRWHAVPTVSAGGLAALVAVILLLAMTVGKARRRATA